MYCSLAFTLLGRVLTGMEYYLLFIVYRFVIWFYAAKIVKNFY